MKRTDIARQGATKLIELEDAIEATLSKAAAFTSTLGQMRLDAKLSMMHGPEVFPGMLETLTMLSNARTSIRQVHQALAEVREGIGCGAMAVGDPPKPPAGGGGVSPEPTNLRVVA